MDNTQQHTKQHTQQQVRLSKPAIFYLAIALIIMIGPLLGMLWYVENPDLQTSELATWPSTTTEDGTPNIDYLPQAGGYFVDHFAYRPEAITLHAQLQTAMLGVSTTDQVIYGKDGWLFYGGTLNDYLGINQPSRRAIFNEAHNLRLLQDYVQASGAEFALTIAPNKNSVISQQMPYWYLPASQPSQKPLIDQLQAAGINYIDLYSLYDQDSLSDAVSNTANTASNAASNSSLPLFFTSDSHWTNAGAYPAYLRIMEQLKPDIPRLELTDSQATVRIDHIGDIEALLYPTATIPEADYYYPLPAYAFFSDEKTVEASSSATINPTGTGTLLMYRDSFANALIPFFSATFNKAYYSKLQPYNLVDMERYNPDVVLVEVAQRSTLSFSANPPALPGPIASSAQAAAIERELTFDDDNSIEQTPTHSSTTTVDTYQDGDYLVVSGILDQNYVSEQALVFVRIAGSDGQIITREAFLTTVKTTKNDTDATSITNTTDFGYKIFLPNAALQLRDCSLDVIIKSDNDLYLMASRIYKGEN